MMTAHAQKKLALVDGSSYLFRAFHGMPPLANSAGQATGAVYGIIKMLQNFYQEQQPDYFAVVFDAKGKNFRHQLFPDYKAQRPPMPPELASQIAPIHTIIKALGYPLLMVADVEADDVIATLATEASALGISTIISTGDKDLAQLVTADIALINTMNNQLLDEAGVYDKFAVRPDQIVDFLSLVGDNSDNIPGVVKVGAKTAAKWLNEHQDLATIIANASDFGGKVGENLRAALDMLPRNQELVRLKRDVTLEHAVTDLICTPTNTQVLVEQYRVLEFTQWLHALENDVREARPPAPAREYHTVFQENFAAFVARLETAEIFALDTETTSLDVMLAQLVGMSFCIAPGEAWYVPLAHNNPEDECCPQQVGVDAALMALRPILEDAKRQKIGQNLKYDMSVLAQHGVELQGVAEDTMLQSLVLDAGRGQHDMDTLAKTHLGVDTLHYEDVAGKGKKQVTFNQVMIDTACEYAAEDADITLQLHRVLSPRLNQAPSLERVYADIEMPLVPVLARIERSGVLIDTDKLAGLSAEFATQMEALETQAYEQAGQAFNLASPRQIQEILFDKMNLPVLRKTPKGQPSTAEDVLTELARDFDLPAIILKHRELGKLKSTYVDSLPTRINPVTGRVHTNYHQAGTVTGRLSSSNPNLQNIPIRSDYGSSIREAFIAPEGSVLIAADYSQIELRIMAHLSGDDSLITAFAEGQDIHRNTAAEVFGVTPTDVTATMRSHAKAVNFGLIYGMSAFGLAKQLQVDRSTAQQYIDLYFARYPKVRAYMDDTREFARQQGFVETVMGRRLHLPEIRSRNHQRRSYAERTAINAPMQGSAADIIKLAMVKVEHALDEVAPKARIIMQVHDELVVEAPQADVAVVSAAMKQAMESVVELSVAMEVDVGVGGNWRVAH
jgi:DNA polymerase I